MDALTSLRKSFFVLGLSQLVFLMASFVVLPRNGEPIYPIYFGIAFFGGLYSLAGAVWSRSRRLNLRDRASLAASYQASFFIGIGITLSGALVGFGLSLVAETIVLYLIGLPFTLVGLLLIAPTRAALDRRQRQITASGSPLSLVESLLASRSGPRGGR